MKPSLRFFGHSAERPARPVDNRRQQRVAGDYPPPGEVLAEIGLILAIHLALAFAVALTLRAAGIA